MSQKVMDWEGKRVSKINEIWMLSGIENQSKNSWISRSKYRKIVNKNASENNVFFDCVFLSILGGFGEGFGTLLGGDLEPVGLSLAVFLLLFFKPLCSRGPKRA